MFDNEVKIIMDSKSCNESFARMCVASFITPLDPTVGELTDIKTAVSEAVTNAIIHGYENKASNGKITLDLKRKGHTVYIEIIDNGKGIENIDEAKTPLYTSKPEQERSGMGFTIMESFMDSMEITSIVGVGTKVSMSKTITNPEIFISMERWFFGYIWTYKTCTGRW